MTLAQSLGAPLGRSLQRGLVQRFNAVQIPSGRPIPQTKASGSFGMMLGWLRLRRRQARWSLIAAPTIEKRIFIVRGRQVMLDEDLADLYGVETKRLIQQVKRNLKRFPEDFMLQLDKAEVEILRSQIATSNDGRGGRRYAPYVFTEQGVAMLSGVLRSDRAIAVNIEIMRTFVELRRVASSYAAIEKRLEEIERELGGHDEQLHQIFKTLRQLISPPVRPKRPVGFRAPEDE